jgi:hypothetical protein
VAERGGSGRPSALVRSGAAGRPQAASATINNVAASDVRAQLATTLIDFSVLYSLVATAERNDINALVYLEDVLVREQAHPAKRVDDARLNTDPLACERVRPRSVPLPSLTLWTTGPYKPSVRHLAAPIFPAHSPCQ